MFWKKPPLQVFARHAFFSRVSQHKKRFPGFSHELCYYNFLDTIDQKKAKITFLFDAARGPLSKHFLKREKNTIQIQEGTEAGSFLRLLEYVATLDLHPDTVIYFVEDDYLHRPFWTEVLLEAFQMLSADYITLYDHSDKYSPCTQLQSRIFVTSSCHWRTVPSTTNTFATRYKTLLRDLSIHREFSEGRNITDDHEKFIRLNDLGVTLVSSIPGWATHAEPEFASPCIDWVHYLNRSLYVSC
jgi:hypothetical protein